MAEHLVFDTSFLSSSSAISEAFKRLEELTSTGRVKVHIHWLVEQELCTQRTADFKRLDRSYFRAASWLPTSQRTALESALETTDKLLEESARMAASGIQEWMSRLKIEQLWRADAEDTTKVFERYFKGERPFKAIKNRSDIPDAFIYALVETLAAKHPGRVHVVGKDNKLCESCASIAGVQSHDDLVRFLAIGTLRPVQPKEIRDFSESHQKELIETIVAKLPDTIVREHARELYDYGRGELTGLGRLNSYGFDFFDSLPISEHSLEIPFTCTLADCEVEVTTEYIAAHAVADQHGNRRQMVRFKEHLDLHIEGRAAVVLAYVGEQLRFEDIAIHSIDSVERAEE